MDALERFHSKRVESENGCKLWIGTRHADGYGRFKTRDGVAHRAHRWIFGQLNGYLPDEVMHRCDTPLCVNWERCLLPGNNALNIADKVSKRRHVFGERMNTAKLTEADVREIRRLYSAGGASLRGLGRAYGVTHRNIRLIVIRETWQQVS